MQLQGIMLLFIMLIMLPIVMLSANHNVFFVIVAIVLFISSIKNIFNLFFNREIELNKEDEELLEDIEITSDIDIRKFGSGLKVVTDLVIILFFLYCAFYMSVLWLKALIAFSILFRVIQIKYNVCENNLDTDFYELSVINKIFYTFSNLCTLFIIITTVYLKFLKALL